MRRFGSERRFSREFARIEVAPGVVVVVPAWMLHPLFCAGSEISEPRISLQVLVMLEGLPIAKGLP